MRIAINIDGQFQAMTGIQHYVDSLIGALLASGTRHEITALAPALPPSSLVEQSARHGGFAWRDHSRLRVDNASRADSFASRQLSRLPFLNRNGNREPFDFENLSQRARHASRRYDLLHVPCPVPLPFETYETPHCIATIYDLTPRLFPETHDAGTIAAWERMFRFAEERCARVLTISQCSKRDIVAHLHIEPERIDVIPLAPRVSARRVEDPAERDHALCALGFTADVPFVLYAGTLEPRKNLERLLEAFSVAITDARLNEHQLVLAGGYSDSYGERLRSSAAVLGIADRVQFTGYVSDDAMNALMSACEVFAYVSEYEGFGLPPLEAMTCGAPVLASNAASLPEVIGDAGLLVSPHDCDAIAAGLTRLLTDPAENARLRECSMRQAMKFSWSKTADLTLRAYEAAVAHPATARRSHAA